MTRPNFVLTMRTPFLRVLLTRTLLIPYRINGMLLPKTKNFTNASDFFKSFYEINKKENSNISYRHLALKLKWPISYIPELIAKKRRLTVQRAIEFSQKLKMKPSDTEKLVFLAIKELVDEPFKIFIDEKFLFNTKATQFTGNINSKEHELFLDLKNLMMHQYLSLKQGKVDINEVLSWQTSMSSLDKNEVLLILKRLMDLNIIKKVDQNTFEILKDELFWSPDSDISNSENKCRTLQIEALYAKNYIEFLKNPKGKGTFTSGFIQISESLFEETRGKINSLRDYLFEQSKKTSMDPKFNREEKNVYQIGLQLFPVLHKKCGLDP